MKIILELFLCLLLALVVSAQEKSKFPIGSYKLRGVPMLFKDDGTYRIGDDKNIYVEGRFKANSNQLTFTDLSGQYACKGKKLQTGKYRSEIKGEGLALRLIKDDCEARRTALLEGVIEKVK